MMLTLLRGKANICNVSVDHWLIDFGSTADVQAVPGRPVTEPDTSYNDQLKTAAKYRQQYPQPKAVLQKPYANTFEYVHYPHDYRIAAATCEGRQ